MRHHHGRRARRGIGRVPPVALPKHRSEGRSLNEALRATIDELLRMVDGVPEKELTKAKENFPVHRARLTTFHERGVLLMSGLPILTWIRFFVWLFIGLAIYYFYSRHRSEFAPSK